MRATRRRRCAGVRRWALGVLGLFAVPLAATADTAAEVVDRVADEVLAATLAERPEEAYFSGLAIERHDGLTDNSPAATAAWQAREDDWLARLDAVDAGALEGRPQWIVHGALREQLAAAVGTRICRGELWQGVSHMASWHTGWASLAEMQPVATADERAQALARWRRTPAFVRQEIRQLRAGLAAGFSAPRTVAERMLRQLDGLLEIPAGEHPFLAPARRSESEGFRAEFTAVIAGELLPAVREFRDFLAAEYLPRARRSLALSELPNGAECYDALLRSYTTLPRGAEQVSALGRRVVDEHRAEVDSLGQRLYGIGRMADLMAAISADEGNRFADAQALLAASREMVARAQAALPGYFGHLPDEPVTVEPIPEFEDGAGAASRYEPSTSSGVPARYRISLLRPGGTTRSQAEIVAFHETWPGHHLQVSYAQRIEGLHPVMRLVFNSGFVEGWARYAEALAEEAGLYATEHAKIERRSWPARGMVVDPGIHVFGWTREQALEFLLESGRFTPESAENMVDRIAAVPGQLTAYDSGAQEIFALRREAESALGDGFDLATFHDALLEHGTLPLPLLRAVVERWIAARRHQPQP